jgi:ornithine decarboxylase
MQDLIRSGAVAPARGVFTSVEALLRAKTSDAPVFCFLPQRLRAVARHFVERFPGEVLYAVKANPDPDVLRWLSQGGVRAFDTASVGEIALARSVVPDAACSFNHPVKTRAAIAEAYVRWGIRDFVVDHERELDKLVHTVGALAGLVIQVRVAAPNPHATISFNAKFGAEPGEAVALLRAVRERGATPAISTHLGYQTTDPSAFAHGLRLIAGVAAEAGVRPAYVNLGGGFPSVLMPKGGSLDDYFDAISRTRAAEPTLAQVPLRCEPGSALAHPGGAVLAQVLLVKRDAIYLNDGIYGALSELMHTRVQPPTRVLMPGGAPRAGAVRPFTVFGPTCDSYDTLPPRFDLPETIAEGDWLYLDRMGAYSSILITDFNGLGAHEFAVIDEPA